MHELDGSSPRYTDLPQALSKSVLHFVPQQGHELRERTEPFFHWVRNRRRHRVWPYSRVALSSPAHTATIGDQCGERPRECINFGSQDYLGLARDARVLDAARAVIDEYGVHSAGSPALAGRTRFVLELENRLSALLRQESCLVYPTGWAAGFGVLAGLVRDTDTIAIDRLAHNCLAEGARHATRSVKHFVHNDLGSLQGVLAEARRERPDNGLFVVAESLYSMDSDSPDLAEVLRLVRRFDAILILDIAHDFGAMGRQGFGLLESLDGPDWPDVLMGSFSKTFASNGGFVAAPLCATEYLRYHSSPMIFSNGISPLQTAIASRACGIVFSEEGGDLRRRLAENVARLRAEMAKRGFTAAGTPSPIVPVYVGDERVARLTSRHLEENGLLANLVEFPAVARGAARFRFQVMSSHGAEAIVSAAEIMARSRQQAAVELEACFPSRSGC